MSPYLIKMSRRAALVAGTAVLSSRSKVFAQATPPAADDAAALLAAAAEAMVALNSVRWKVRYLDGSTELFEATKVGKAEGVYKRPNLLLAKAEAKAGFLSVDLHAVSNGETVWIDAVGFDRTIDPSEELSAIISDPLNIVAEVLLAVDDPVITGVEEVDGESLTTVSGVFNSSRLTDENLLVYVPDDLMLEATVVINEQNLVVSATQSGAVVGYDSNNVVRIVEFSDYNEAFEIDIPD